MLARRNVGLGKAILLQGQIVGLEALVTALGCGDDRRIADERVVDSGVRNQVRLELVQIDVQCAIKAERRRDRGDYLGDQAVQVLE